MGGSNTIGVNLPQTACASLRHSANRAFDEQLRSFVSHVIQSVPGVVQNLMCVQPDFSAAVPSAGEPR
jgi:hypothetical protein